MIQQNVGGHPVAVYRFSPHTRLPAHQTLTVWCGTSDPMLHQPPTDFVWKEHERWGTGPECTTILCKPNGQVRGHLQVYRFYLLMAEIMVHCITV